MIMLKSGQSYEILNRSIFQVGVAIVAWIHPMRPERCKKDLLRPYESKVPHHLGSQVLRQKSEISFFVRINLFIVRR